MEPESFEMKSSFFHENIEENTLMSQLKGFEQPWKEKCSYILQISLYGLKQYPRR